MPAKFINIAFQIEFSDEISFGFVMKPNEIHKVFCAVSSFASDSLLSGSGFCCADRGFVVHAERITHIILFRVV